MNQGADPARLNGGFADWAPSPAAEAQNQTEGTHS